MDNTGSTSKSGDFPSIMMLINNRDVVGVKNEWGGMIKDNWENLSLSQKEHLTTLFNSGQ